MVEIRFDSLKSFVKTIPDDEEDNDDKIEVGKTADDDGYITLDDGRRVKA